MLKKSEWPTQIKLKAMKNNTPASPSKKKSNVKEISDGVYINLNKITSDITEFEHAIEESFKELKVDEQKTISKKENNSKNFKK